MESDAHAKFSIYCFEVASADCTAHAGTRFPNGPATWSSDTALVNCVPGSCSCWVRARWKPGLFVRFHFRFPTSPRFSPRFFVDDDPLASGLALFFRVWTTSRFTSAWITSMTTSYRLISTESTVYSPQTTDPMFVFSAPRHPGTSMIQWRRTNCYC